jgi:hypothetical protein
MVMVVATVMMVMTMVVVMVPAPMMMMVPPAAVVVAAVAKTPWMPVSVGAAMNVFGYVQPIRGAIDDDAVGGHGAGGRDAGKSKKCRPGGRNEQFVHSHPPVVP